MTLKHRIDRPNHLEGQFTNAKLESIRGHHVTSHGKHDTTHTKLDTINTTLTSGSVVNISTLSTHAKQDTANGKLDTLVSQTANNGGIYSAQVHIRDINLPQLHTDIHAFKDANHVDLGTLETKTNLTNTKLDTLETSNQLNRGFLEQIEGHIETMSENQSTFADGDSVVVSGVSTASNQTTIASNVLSLGVPLAAGLVNSALTNTKLTRSWGTLQTIEGNLIVLAGATHSGSSSFTTIPTKPLLVYVKSHNVITDWFGVIQGSIDNTTWLSTEITTISVINASRLGYTPAQQATAYINNPPYPYLRVKITNSNSADRGFEIKINQTN